MFLRLALGMTFVAGGLLTQSARADAPVPAAPVVQPAPAPNAAAACPNGDDTACGRLEFEAGTRAFEQGDFERARRAFLRALELRPHPVIRYNLALCWARSGKPGAAIRELQLVLADDKTDAPLRARSERELRAAEQARAQVTLTLSDPPRDHVELDGAALPTGTRELALDPGSHHVRIISGASIVLDQDVELSPGERVELRVGERSRRIDVVLVPDAHSVAAGQASRAQEGARRGLAPVWFFAAAGVTAVVTTFTVWSALDTERALSDYHDQLPSLTQAEADRLVRDGHARELRTNLLLSGSLVCAAGTAALGLWFVDFRANQSTRVAVGVGQLSVSTRF